MFFHIHTKFIFNISFFHTVGFSPWRCHNVETLFPLWTTLVVLRSHGLRCALYSVAPDCAALRMGQGRHGWKNPSA